MQKIIRIINIFRNLNVSFKFSDFFKRIPFKQKVDEILRFLKYIYHGEISTLYVINTQDINLQTNQYVYIPI